MNPFLKLAQNRESVRSYHSTAVEPDVLWRVLEAARLAPTAQNAQPIRVIVIPVKGRETELMKIYRKDWFAQQPPLVLAVCLVRSEAWIRERDGRNYGDVDAAIVMDHIVMAAQAENLGTCWVAGFDPEAVKQVLRLPDGVEPIVFTPLGYSAQSWGKAMERKTYKEFVMFHYWSRS